MAKKVKVKPTLPGVKEAEFLGGLKEERQPFIRMLVWISMKRKETTCFHWKMVQQRQVWVWKTAQKSAMLSDGFYSSSWLWSHFGAAGQKVHALPQSPPCSSKKHCPLKCQAFKQRGLSLVEKGHLPPFLSSAPFTREWGLFRESDYVQIKYLYPCLCIWVIDFFLRFSKYCQHNSRHSQMEKNAIPKTDEEGERGRSDSDSPLPAISVNSSW